METIIKGTITPDPYKVFAERERIKRERKQYLIHYFYERNILRCYR